MRRILFRLNGIDIHSFPAMLYLGLLAGVLAGAHEARLSGLSPDRFALAILILLALALVGLRALVVLTHHWLFLREVQSTWRRSQLGFGAYAGLIAAMPLSVPVLRVLRLAFAPFWAVAICTLLVTVFFIKAGCLLNGCCCGRATRYWFGLGFADHRGVRRRRVPSQLLEMIFAAMLLAVATFARDLEPFTGAMFLSAIVGLSAVRYILWQRRDDDDGCAIRTTFIARAITARLSSERVPILQRYLEQPVTICDIEADIFQAEKKSFRMAVPRMKTPTVKMLSASSDHLAAHQAVNGIAIQIASPDTVAETNPAPGRNTKISEHVTIVVLTWNGIEDSRRCLESIRNHTNLSRAAVVVVDNGSTDGTLAWARDQKWFRLIENGTNLGFARGNNIGIESSPIDDDVVLINNDIIVQDPDWLERIREAAEASEVGIVGCRMLQPDGTLLHVGTFIDSDTFWGQQIGAGELDIGQYTENREVQGIVFACAYLKRGLLNEVGLLDATYGSYFEDTDLCERARQAGWKIVLCGQTTAIHHEHGSSRANPSFDFMDRFLRSQEIFRRKWGAQFDPAKTGLLWQSILNHPTGYATSSRYLLRSLEEIGAHPSYRYVYGDGTPWPLPESQECGDYLLNVIHNRPSDPNDPCVVYGQGDVFLRASAQRRIGYTMLEVNGFPDEWVRQANQMDEVWVPASFNVEGLRRCGMRRTVRVMPLGVDVDHFHPRVKPLKLPYGFVFLTVLEWGERKSCDTILSIFNDEVRRSEDVVLICKVMNRDGSVDLHSEIAKLRLKRSGGRIRLLLNYQVPHYQMAALYRTANCVLFPSHGEGWNMPAVEAMACGCPVIATAWGAHLDYMTDSNSLLLRNKGCVPAVAKCPYYAGFEWAEPDPEHLRHLIRYAIEHPNEIGRVGRRASEDIRSRYSWRQSADRIRDRLQALYDG